MIKGNNLLNESVRLTTSGKLETLPFNILTLVYLENRSFRFLKDPLFLRTRVLRSPQNREMSVASSIFLKSPKRIAALGMIMSLSLLVYNLGQRQLRQALAASAKTIPDQFNTVRLVAQVILSAP